MAIDFSSNHFELFDLPVAFDLNEAQLSTRFQSLQRELHPDRFASATAAEKRWSMQAASLVNEAYQKLSKPLTRACYLLELNNVNIDEETDTSMNPEFLMQQMELRESLEEAAAASDPFKALDETRMRLSEGAQQRADQFAAAASTKDWDAARAAVREWQFFDKLKREVRAVEARLDE